MRLRSLAVVVCALALCSCGEDDESFAPPPSPTAPSVAQQLAATGLGQFLGLTPTATRRNGDWEELTYDPAAEQAICLGGTPYQVNLRRGSTNKVLLYLEGGGACWSFDTCWQNPTAKQTANSAAGVGILDAANAANPFADWNVVYAPYCDGSVFSGNNIVDYNGKRTFHHGVQNLSAAISLMQREFPHPEVVVVSGSSAGGYGTFTGYGVTRIAYPNAPLLVLDDCGPGLQNPAAGQDLQDRLTNWRYTQYVPADCSDCTSQPAYLADWGLTRDPMFRAALFEYQQDGVIRFFLQLSGPAFQSLLEAVSGDIHARHPDRFRRFLKAGSSHTVLELPGFYSVAVNGITVRDWTADFLDDGPAWQDIVEP